MAWPNSPTATINQFDQYNFFPYGMALLDFGLAVQGANNGFGLVTRGLVWQGYDIWFDPTPVAGVSTIWATYTFGVTVATGWTTYTFGITVSTGWSPSTVTSFVGEFPSTEP